MTAQLIDLMTSLAALMEEESAKVARSPHLPELAEIAGAKLRLTGQIDAAIARLKRESQDWVEALGPDARAQLAESSRHLRDASQVNAQILSRQIELTVDMMAAIAAEAQRLTGTRSSTYGACGGLSGTDASAPISINAKL
jgi:flagellar biosynthesis/type III secretory pathway chaperone